MIGLTEQQWQAVDASPEPVRLIDPRTNKTYVLIDADAYERIKVLRKTMDFPCGRLPS